jgi:TetR/AcrR family transcriptional repressor of bet genes
MPFAAIRNIRRQELLEAAFTIMKREGLQNTTIKKIAKEIGASKGIVHHYFKNKQELIEYTMRYAHASRRLDAAKRLRHSTTPSDRLWAVLSVILDPLYLERGFCRLWISFSAEASRDPQLARLERAIHRRERSNLLHALRQIVPEAKAKDATLGVKALIEGFRLRAALWSKDFDPAIATIEVLSFLRQKIPAFDGAVYRVQSQA